MRNDIETREIADDELDAVSGGVSISGGLLGAVTGDVFHVVNTVTSLDTVHGALALPGQVEGIVGVRAGVAGL
ncbi:MULTISPECIES: hypothetical protein [unclassified Streptomyces]|uniref:Type A2 lantipeptide n=1 Tax=Streptomyces sp. R33 TaxID=3238629 RepID=A0AB39XZY5_9ACTN|nr:MULTISPECIES: hypothetical protein [unclassified Streptomyces]KJY47114.1 hypothetical protein VR46_05365 [Streptomyces sp. NRRL S-444]WSW42673.1 hypothetical protein OG296_05815 [Streptomyces sp. NBC_01001]WSW62909.1 hypothetical protein OG513_32425 [Streptomyces sp. NBC_00998]KOY55489.1 hypothetical protein ADK59_24075 [Streptomyces sp. XY332]MCX4626474.1 hypothetical protein [Streptomyces sp. NBC_01443]